MRKIVVASHGRMAEGIVHSVSFFAGENSDLSFICAYTDSRPLEETIKSYFDSLTPDHEVIIFTDLLGGSVNRAFLPYTARPHTHLIAGVHLALVLEFILKPDRYLEENEIKEIVENSKTGVAYMNTYTIEADEEDE